MQKKNIFLFFFIVAGFILSNLFNFNMNKLFSNNSSQAYAYACKNLNAVGRSYCFDKTNINYMTVGIYENPNDYKSFIRLKDEGYGIPVEIIETNTNAYKEVFYKVRVKNRQFKGWINSKFIKHN